MSAKSAHLTLRQERCNQCGRCTEVCPNDAIRVGADYLLVDSHACNYCCGCVDVCDQQAIQRTVVPIRSAVAAPAMPSDVTKVVVGSRAEAKAVRKAAEQAGRADPATASAPPRRRDASAAPAARAASGALAVPIPLRARGESSERGAAAEASAPKPAGWEFLGATWTLVDAFVVLAVLLATILAKNVVLGLPAVGLMPAAGRAWTRAAVLAAYYAVQLSALVLLAGRHGCTFTQAFGLARSQSAEGSGAASPERPSVLVSAGITVALLVGVEVVAISYGLIAQAAGWKQPMALSADVSAVFGGGGLGLVLSVVLIALVAPVAEELSFRGVILPAVGSRWGVWPGIMVSAALFAVYHVTVWLFLPMLVLGIALGWLTVTRRSLWPAIVLHVLYNSLAVAAAFMVPR
jgi:membrane protease YdiL (CAAX protease family)/NAD-dependent dihydropyrimidine dehydrogenase PreA subunit